MLLILRSSNDSTIYEVHVFECDYYTSKKSQTYRALVGAEGQ